MTTKGLEAARKRRLEMVEQGIEIQRLNPIEKANASLNSKALAIAAKCYDCVGQDGDPNWQKRVRSCQITDCPLWPVRRPQ